MLEGSEHIMQDKNLHRANPVIVLREEFDDWAVLFNPDSGDIIGLNPVSVFIWKCLDGRHSIEDILKKMNRTFENVSIDAKDHIIDFIQNLIRKGLAE
jgi:SynChlorMet cassette protein ScmD